MFAHTTHICMIARSRTHAHSCAGTRAARIITYQNVNQKCKFKQLKLSKRESAHLPFGAADFARAVPDVLAVHLLDGAGSLHRVREADKAIPCPPPLQSSGNREWCKRGTILSRHSRFVPAIPSWPALNPVPGRTAVD